MNTKSMILTLNSLIFFNTISHGFSISSLRKKVVETCTDIRKKTIAIIGIMAIALLYSLSMRGGAFALAALRSPWKRSHRPFPVTPVRTIHHYPGPVNHNQEQEIIRRPTIPPYAFFRAASMSYPRGSWGSSLKLQTPVQQNASSDSSDYEEEIEVNPAQPVHHLPEELRGTLLDKIPYLERNEETGEYKHTILVDTEGMIHKNQEVPEEIAQLITQFVCNGEFYHDRDLRVPNHYSDPSLITGRHSNHVHPEKKVTISFPDGDPNILQLALLPRLYRNSTGQSPSTRYIDTIDIDTRTYRQQTTKNVENVFYVPHCPSVPTSYLQKVSSRAAVPLKKQLTFTSHGSSAYDSSEGTAEITEFEDGIQRDLVDDRGIWFVPYDRDFGDDCNKYVGIYEKGDPNNDFQVKWHRYFDPVKKDDDGKTYLLRQVVKTPTSICSISVPNTPVRLQNSKEEIVSGKKYYGKIPEGISTVLSDSLPTDISIFAVGQKTSRTNNYCSIYKRRGNNLRDYSPYLLMYQQDPMAQRGETEMLYQDTWSTPIQWVRYGYYRTGASQLRDSIKLGAIVAGAYFAYKGIALSK